MLNDEDLELYKKRLDDLWYGMLECKRYYEAAQTLQGKAHFKSAYKYYMANHREVSDRLMKGEPFYLPIVYEEVTSDRLEDKVQVEEEVEKPTKNNEGKDE